MLQDFEYGVITLYDETFQTLLLSIRHQLWPSPTTPQSKLTWFGLIRVRSPLLAESLLISFPRGT